MIRTDTSTGQKRVKDNKFIFHTQENSYLETICATYGHNNYPLSAENQIQFASANFHKMLCAGCIISRIRELRGKQCISC